MNVHWIFVDSSVLHIELESGKEGEMDEEDNDGNGQAPPNLADLNRPSQDTS